MPSSDSRADQLGGGSGLPPSRWSQLYLGTMAATGLLRSKLGELGLDD